MIFPGFQTAILVFFLVFVLFFCPQMFLLIFPFLHCESSCPAKKSKMSSTKGTKKREGGHLFLPAFSRHPHCHQIYLVDNNHPTDFFLAGLQPASFAAIPCP